MVKNVLKNKNDKFYCECKKPLKLHICKRNYIWNARTGACKCEYLNNYTRLKRSVVFN